MATNWIDGETEVTAENLIKDQTAVQITEPTGGQGVWIKDSKNLFDGITESGAYNSSGVKTTDNTMTRTANKIPVKPSASYIWSNNGTGVPMNVFEYDRNGAFISSQTGITANSSFTTTSTTYFITAYKGNANTDKLQLEYGSTIHAYESYIENPTINTNINGQYKEIYNKDNMGDLIVDDIQGKNLLDFTQFEASKTSNGITFTNNSDGTITVNGTATNNANFLLLGSDNNQKNIIGNYITGGINSNVTVRVVNKTGSTYTILGASSGSPSTINKSFDTGYIELRVANGTTVNNQIIKPMMTYNEDSNFTPYKEFDSTPITKIWSGSVYNQNDTMTLSKKLEVNKLYMIRYFDNSSYFYGSHMFLYLGGTTQNENLAQINFYNYDDGTRTRYRLKYNGNLTVSIKLANNGSSARAITDIYEIK